MEFKKNKLMLIFAALVLSVALPAIASEREGSFGRVLQASADLLAAEMKASVHDIKKAKLTAKNALRARKRLSLFTQSILHIVEATNDLKDEAFGFLYVPLEYQYNALEKKVHEFVKEARASYRAPEYVQKWAQRFFTIGKGLCLDPGVEKDFSKAKKERLLTVYQGCNEEGFKKKKYAAAYTDSFGIVFPASSFPDTKGTDLSASFYHLSHEVGHIVFRLLDREVEDDQEEFEVELLSVLVLWQSGCDKVILDNICPRLAAIVKSLQVPSLNSSFPYRFGMLSAITSILHQKGVNTKHLERIKEIISTRVLRILNRDKSRFASDEIRQDHKNILKELLNNWKLKNYRAAYQWYQNVIKHSGKVEQLIDVLFKVISLHNKRYTASDLGKQYFVFLKKKSRLFASLDDSFVFGRNSRNLAICRKGFNSLFNDIKATIKKNKKDLGKKGVRV